jgi:hypothetical protein
MRKIVVSMVAGTVLVVVLMVLGDTSMALRPDVARPAIDEPPVLVKEVKAPVRPGEEPEPASVGRNISLRGTIDDLPPDPPYTGTWKIEIDAGEVISVEVTDQTRILPPGIEPEVADAVHVLARSEGSDGEETLVALRVTVEKARNRRGRPLHFRGEIEFLPADPMSGTWSVSGISVTVDAETMIHPPDRTPEVGMVANVVAFEHSDGTLWAMNITLQTPQEAASGVELEGTIEDLPDTGDFVGTWVVDGISVTVTADTELKGAAPAIGLTAKVRGHEQDDGSIAATEIKVKGPEHEEVEFEGAVVVFTDTRPSVWVIDTDPATDSGEISVTVTSSTYINENKGPLEEGSWVEVKALRQPDGTLEAVRIKVEDESAAATEVEFTAPIAELPSPGSGSFNGQWIFATDPVSTTVVVTPQTEIEGDPAVGLTAKVEGFLQGDGFVHAESIEIQPEED